MMLYCHVQALRREISAVVAVLAFEGFLFVQLGIDLDVGLALKVVSVSTHDGLAVSGIPFSSSSLSSESESESESESKNSSYPPILTGGI